jgi:hypothetical protein
VLTDRGAAALDDVVDGDRHAPRLRPEVAGVTRHIFGLERGRGSTVAA